MSEKLIDGRDGRAGAESVLSEDDAECESASRGSGEDAVLCVASAVLAAVAGSDARGAGGDAGVGAATESAAAGGGAGVDAATETAAGVGAGAGTRDRQNRYSVGMPARITAPTRMAIDNCFRTGIFSMTVGSSGT